MPAWQILPFPKHFAFGSVQAIRDAAVAEIVSVGIPERLALRIKELL